MNDRKRIALLAGDGIGPEVIAAAVAAVRATAAPVDFTAFDWGAERYLRDGTTVPHDGLPMLARDFDAILLGAFGDPRVPSNVHARDILLGMRFTLDLYANVRPVKLLDGSLCPLKDRWPADVNFTVIRENTEGMYGDVGGVFKQGTPDEIATQQDINTRKGVERIIRYAFDYACANGFDRVTMADKSNALTHAGSLWQRAWRQVGEEYPEIAKRHFYIDALCLALVREPQQFGVIVTNNLFGDIITDLGAALQGGLGMAASANIHPGRLSMFEPVHGSAPAMAGKDQANPIGAIASAALMLDHLGLKAEARRIDEAIVDAVRGRCLTADVGGELGTAECGRWIAERIARGG